MGRLSMCFPAKCSHTSTPNSSKEGEEAPSHHSRVEEAEVSSQTHPQERSPVSGSHWCSQGSRRRRAHRSRAQGPLEFCWEKRTTCAGFSQSLASSWLPSSRMNRLPATETRGVSDSHPLLHPPSMVLPCIPSIL